MPRLFPTTLALLVLAVAVWLLWPQQGAHVTATPTTAGQSAETASRDQGSNDGKATPATAAPLQRDDATAPPVDPQPFVVSGLVLGDERRPQLDDLRVVAYQGEPTDSPAIVMSGLNRRGKAPAFVLVGNPVAIAKVGQAGNFELRAPTRHLRLSIEHELYTLPAPELVHVPADGAVDNVVLSPLLGACIKGRLFGPRASKITAVRANIEPDPMSMIRDMRSYMGAMMSMGRLRAEPDDDGKFVFRGVIPGASVTILAEGEGAFAQSHQPPLVAGETREVPVAVRNAASLCVTVRDEKNEGIARARVAVRALDAGDSMFSQLRSRRGATDGDGVCTIPSIEPTRVLVEALAAGYTAAEATIDLTADDEPQQIELVLGEGGVVTGTVFTPDGEPLAGAGVAHHPMTEIPLIGDMADQLGAAYLAEIATRGVKTDDEGKFRLTGLADDGEFHVVGAHPDYGASLARGVRMGATDVSITLQTLGAIRGCVVADEDDSPLGEFTVRVIKSMFLVIRAPVLEEAITAADGVFALTQLPPGEYTLEVEAEGRSIGSKSIDFTHGDLDVGTIRLTRGAFVTGQVQDEAGAPIRGALVRRRQGALADNPMMAMFGGAARSTRTDTDGHFELGPLPTRRLQLLASAAGYASGRSERLALQAGQTSGGIVITLGHGGTIEGVLSPGPGNHLHDFMLMAQHQQTQASFGADLGEDGAFRFENLDPGPYVVQAMPNDLFGSFGAQNFRPGQGMDLGRLIQKISSSVVSQRCTVRAGETSEVALDAADLVVGTRWQILVEVGGERLQTGILEATSIASGRLRATMFSEGAAVIGNVEPGSYEVRIRSGMTLAPVGSAQLLEFPSGREEFTSRISLPGGELRGKVLDAATDEPLHAALVRLVHEESPERDDLFGMALTDREGEFVFPGLADGTYGVVAAEHLGLSKGAVAQRGIRIVGGAASEPVILRARPAATASVVVTSASGAPIVGATVLCVDEAGRPLGSLGLATTDGAGRAWFGGMPRGTARVVGRAPGLAPAASEARAIDPSQPTEFLLTLRSGARTTVHVVDGEGSPRSGATITARCNDGPWLPAMLLVERHAVGTFEIGHLSPGTWDIRVHHPAAGTVVQRRTIGSEPAVTIVIPMP